jgi:hypothetical protein
MSDTNNTPAHIASITTGSMDDDNEANLIGTWRYYCYTEKLPLQSADELIHHPDLTVAQRLVISAFIHRWTAWEHRTFNNPQCVPKDIHWYNLSVDAYNALGARNHGV